mmetsp:Transcript_60758/g.130536  ORF Transcript_60758/g.130536 Transcript_60758/m.130536 type:complete len:209 (-) Transcript_60758:758-1384(-)
MHLLNLRPTHGVEVDAIPIGVVAKRLVTKQPIEQCVDERFRHMILVKQLPTIPGGYEAFVAPALVAVEKRFWAIFNHALVHAGLHEQLLDPAVMGPLAMPITCSKHYSHHCLLEPSTPRCIAIDTNVQESPIDKPPHRDMRENVALRLHHVLELGEPGLHQRSALRCPKMAVDMIEAFRCLEGLHPEAGDDAWEAATTATYHPVHICI